MRDTDVCTVLEISDLSKPEICDLRFAGRTQQDVFRLDVAMHDTAIAGLLKGGGNLAHEVDDDCDAQRPVFGKQLLQVLAGYILLNQEVNAVDTIDPVNLNDIRVDEGGNGLRFIMKATNVGVIAG